MEDVINKYVDRQMSYLTDEYQTVIDNLSPSLTSVEDKVDINSLFKTIRKNMFEEAEANYTASGECELSEQQMIYVLENAQADYNIDQMVLAGLLKAVTFGGYTDHRFTKNVITNSKK
jgi:hypothetical protein